MMQAPLSVHDIYHLTVDCCSETHFTLSRDTFIEAVFTTYESVIDLIASDVRISHVRMSGQQQRVVATFLHIEPKVVQWLELRNLGLVAAGGRFEEPFPEILKGREGRGGEARPQQRGQRRVSVHGSRRNHGSQCTAKLL